MNKISNKIFIGFGIFILILLIQLVLNQLITKNASVTYDELTTKVMPAAGLLSDFRTANKELILLVTNKMTDSKNEMVSNNIKEIIEVELPYFRSNTVALKNSLELSDPRNERIDAIAENTSKSIALIEEINSLLLTSKDYENRAKMEMITVMVNDRLSGYSIEIENGIAFVQRGYNKELENNFFELSNALLNNSRIFLFSSLVFIGFGLVITFKITRSIVKPINALLDSVHNIIEGNYKTRVTITGKDELSILGGAFNQMSDSLTSSFNQIQAKNKELEQFVYIASHDLQEPLRTVNSFTALLEEENATSLDEMGASYLRFISQASHRMSLLVKGLLDYSRIGRTKKLETINCNDLMAVLADDLSVLISTENARLEVGILPEVLAYRTEFRLLFQNLITNAIKFHKPNISPIVQINVEEENDFWKFLISDNGIGIAENQREKIFGIFHRLNTQNEYVGTGIGLAHCTKIIEMHGGSIQVESEISRGSTFSITISKNLYETETKMRLAN